MTISEATIKEMQKILKEDYGQNITQAEALEITRTLVGYFDLLAKIYHRNNLSPPQKRNSLEAIKKDL